MKDDLMKILNNFFHGRSLEEGVNHSFITLIPKKIGVDSIEDFRPISLVGGIYKILSKVLARRLKGCMDTVISKSQFAFIPERQILDYALIANEAIDHMQKKTGLKGPVFKIDFKWAYDTVDWHFIIRIMKEMGFGDRWCRWLFTCISTAIISILIYGTPTTCFSLTRGLRQG